VFADFDSERESAHLGVGRRALRDDSAFAWLLDRKVRRLHQQTSKHLFDVEFVAIDRRGIEGHHPPIFLLAQKRDHFIRIRWSY